MRRSRGQTRRVTDAQIQMLRNWKPFKQLAREIGIGVTHAASLRTGKYQHKTRSP